AWRAFVADRGLRAGPLAGYRGSGWRSCGFVAVLCEGLAGKDNGFFSEICARCSRTAPAFLRAVVVRGLPARATGAPTKSAALGPIRRGCLPQRPAVRQRVALPSARVAGRSRPGHPPATPLGVLREAEDGTPRRAPPRAARRRERATRRAAARRSRRYPAALR